MNSLVLKSSSKKRKPKTLQASMKKWKPKFDYEDDAALEDDDDDFGFEDETKEEISYSHKGDDDEEAEEADAPSAMKFLQKLQAPQPNYVQLTIFEEKSNCDKCWGCLHRFGTSRIRTKNASADTIFGEFIRNKTDLPLEALCNLLQDMQAALVWRPSVKAVALAKKGVAVEPWPSDIVMSHLVDHMQDAALKMKALIRDAALIEKTLKNTLIQNEEFPDGSTKPTPVLKHLMPYIRFNVYQIQLQKYAEVFKGSAQTKKN